MIDKELEQRLARIEGNFRQIIIALEDINKDIFESISALRAGFPKHTIVSCGSIAESILKRIWIKESIKGNPTEKTLEPLMQLLKDHIENRLIYDYLRDIQVARNQAAHGEIILEEDAVEVLRKLSTVINWYLTKYESPKQGTDNKPIPSSPVELKPPPEPVSPPPRLNSRPPVESAPAKASKTRRNWLIGFAGIALVGLLLGVIIRMPVPPPPTPPVTITPQPTSPTKDSMPAPGKEFQDKLKDGSPGPKMVVIPAGTFLMGSPHSEEGRDNDEKQHQVRIERNFAIGKYEVTVGQFKSFVKATQYKTEVEESGRCYYWTGSAWKPDAGKTWRNPGFSQTDDHPVVCVSWNDAIAYVDWLSEQTGKTYRLPTEAEWEYAARAGTQTAYYWGNDLDQGCSYANRADQTVKEQFPDWKRPIMNCRDDSVYTAPVGRFRPNAWGLYDMLGNVWEWTCSEYHKGYGGAEQRCVGDQSAAGLRVVRGGSWLNVPRWLRGAARYGGYPHGGGDDGGFRLARTFSL